MNDDLRDADEASDQSPSPMVRRVAAAQATLDQFRDKPLRLGYRDCVRMAAAHLRRLGYKVKLPPAGSYRSLKSATRALEKLGHKTLADGVDAVGMERIAPAAAIAGDLLQLEAPEPGGLVIALGNGRVIGYHEEIDGAAVLQPVTTAIAAWRVEPQ